MVDLGQANRPSFEQLYTQDEIVGQVMPQVSCALGSVRHTVHRDRCPLHKIHHLPALIPRTDAPRICTLVTS